MMNPHWLANLYDAIVNYKRDNDGATPPIRWLGEQTGISSTSTVRYYLDELERQELIHRSGNDLSGRASVIKVAGARWLGPKEAAIANSN